MFFTGLWPFLTDVHQFVILSVALDLYVYKQIQRYAQDDSIFNDTQQLSARLYWPPC